jgi:hemerythrin-like domain-containing protein
MLREHQLGRHYVKAMSEAYATYKAADKSTYKDITKNGHGYISLLKDHIDKENNVLFVMVDSRLLEKRQDELFEGFEKIEDERIGVGKHEQFHPLLEKLSGLYLN